VTPPEPLLKVRSTIRRKQSGKFAPRNALGDGFEQFPRRFVMSSCLSSASPNCNSVSPIFTNSLPLHRNAVIISLTTAAQLTGVTPSASPTSVGQTASLQAEFVMPHLFCLNPLVQADVFQQARRKWIGFIEGGLFRDGMAVGHQDRACMPVRFRGREDNRC